MIGKKIDLETQITLIFKVLIFNCDPVVNRIGFEPMTFPLAAGCSIQLSYRSFLVCGLGFVVWGCCVNNNRL